MDLLQRLRVLDVHMRVEKGRVRISAPKGSITPELERALLAHRDDLRRMLEAQDDDAVLVPVPRDDSLPLSFFQERLWLADQLEPGSTRYNLAALLGPRTANVEHLAGAVRQVIARHEILRSRFVLEREAPVVHLASSDDTPLLITDLRDRSTSERQQLLGAAVADAVRVPFDLAAEAPVRFHIFRTAPDEVTLLVSAHHIAVDSWSFALLAREIWSAYDALAASAPPGRPLALQYADFAHWQRRTMEMPGALAHLRYWKKRLSGVPQLSIFPPDHQLGTTAGGGGAAHPFQWPVELYGAVRALARECDATMYMVLLAGLVAVLHRRTGQTDIAVGCPLGTRDKAELESMIGPILNPIVLRFDLSDDPTFAQLVEQARVSVLEGHLHKDVPFERVVQEISPRRSLSHPPLFQIAVVVHNAPDVSTVPLAGGGSVYDLTLFARERGPSLEGAFEYRSDLYAGDTIRKISADLDTLLAAAARDRALRISELPQSAVRTPAAAVGRPIPSVSATSDDDGWRLAVEAASIPANPNLALRLRGALDQKAITVALGELLRRHESLRWRPFDNEGTPRAQVGNAVELPIRIIDVANLDEPGREQEVGKLMRARIQEPFDLERGPLAHFLLVRCATEEHLLLICMHHSAADEPSLAIAVRDIFSAYDATLRGTAWAHAASAVQCADGATSPRESGSEISGRELDYWRGELAGAPALLSLPIDRGRRAVPSYRSATRTGRVPADLLDRLKDLAREHHVTLYMLLLSVWQMLLYRVSGQEDILVGSSTADSDRSDLDGRIGRFVHTLVLRGRFDGNPPFPDYLRQVKATVLRALAHRQVPVDHVIDALRRDGGPSQSPLFQVLFRFCSLPVEAMRPHGLDVEPLDRISAGSSPFDLIVDIFECHDGRLTYEYATDLFDAATIERMHAQFVALLRHIAVNADQCVGDIPLQSTHEESTLLNQLNARAFQHDRSQCVHDLVAEAAARTPDAVAVVAQDGTRTYAALEERANQLAHLLRARGVRTGALVAVCIDRTSNLPVALLAVLKAGAAYVPLDPLHPRERLLYILRDAQVTCVVTDAQSSDAVANAEIPVVLVGNNPELLAAQPTHSPEVGITSRDLAYVIYTSGSTGRPKGVELEHRNVVSLLRAMQEEPGIRSDDVLLAVTTPSFDIAGLELFLPLVSGARTVIATRDEVFDGDRLWQRMESCNATIMQATPATWRLLIDTGWPGKTDLTALCGGEALPRDLARTLSTRVHALWNMYGPTETTIWSTVHLVTDYRRSIPIGHAIANTTVYVLDSAGCQTPIGVTGELCIGGEGVGRGYHGRAELTAEKFVTLQRPGRMPERVYRTGDLVRLRSDLALEFVGRRDDQVKIRGHRIELAEIEAVLAEHPSVRRTAVSVHANAPGDERLVAYVVLAQGTGAIDEDLRSLLRSRLPEYMVPSTIVSLDALPLTPNGKIDRNVLPAPEDSHPQDQSTYVEPRTPTEKLIAGVWAEVLHLRRVGVADNFFHLGGHSLLVTRMMARLKAALGVELPLRTLFDAPTVAELAERVCGVRIAAESPRWNCLVPIQTRGTSPPLFVVAGYNYEDETMLILSRLIPHLGSDQPIYGLRPRWLGRNQSAYHSVEEMARECLGELRTIQPHGPYLLGGLCIASSVAIEIARLLTQQGEAVQLLAMIDAGRPCRLRSLLWRSEKSVRRAMHMIDVIRKLLISDGRRRKELVLEVLHRKFRSGDATSVERPAQERFHELKARHMRLLVDHRPEPYEGDITQISSDEYHRFNRYMAWSPIIKGGVIFHKLPGDHQMLLTRHMGTLAHLLRIGMESARSQAAPVADSVPERPDVRPFHRLRASSSVQAVLCWLSGTGATMMM
jgi:amino acid adenylation domain-containing protein